MSLVSLLEWNVSLGSADVSWGGGRLRRRLDFDWLNPRRQHHATMATYDLQQMYSVQRERFKEFDITSTV